MDRDGRSIERFGRRATSAIACLLVAAVPLGFNNTFAILVRGADARRQGLKTIDDVAPLTPRLRAGFESWLDPANFDSAGHQRTRLRAGP